MSEKTSHEYAQLERALSEARVYGSVAYWIEELINAKIKEAFDNARIFRPASNETTHD